MSTTRKIPDSLEYAYHSIQTVLDSLDALVYVSDMDTHEMLFVNRYGREIWGAPQGRRCWEILQAGQSGPCDFCTNKLLKDDEGKSTGVYVWEFQNTVDKKWYQCRDQAIEWVDGRIVRMEIATDISDRKAMEDSLKQAHESAREMAYTDELTGVLSRRGLFSYAQQEFARAERSSEPVAVLMIDIDNFKLINDTWGHVKGDKILESLAQAVKKELRESDLFGRIGGDEFSVILPSTDSEEAGAIAERIRKTVYTLLGRLKSESCVFSCSIGMTIKRGDDISFDRALLLADRALYRSKLAGRNRVESFHRQDDESSSD